MSSMIIVGGTGTPNAAQVDDGNRLRTFAITEPEDKHVNREGKAWSLFFTVTPTGAGDYFFYLKNTGTVDLAVTSFRISSTVITEILIEHVSGTASHSSANNIVASNRNLGSSGSPGATIVSDVDTTGLTTESTLFSMECNVANQLYWLHPASEIIMPQGSALAMQRVAATGLLTCVVSLVGLD